MSDLTSHSGAQVDHNKTHELVKTAKSWYEVNLFFRDPRIDSYSGVISPNQETVTLKSNPVFNKCYNLPSVSRTEDLNTQLQ